MKIPKTFRLEKSLENKTKQLMEKRLSNPKNVSEKHGELYEELKTEFPNFTEYLFNNYPNLGVFKVKDKNGADIWKFYTIPPKKKNPSLVGQIEKYVEQCSKDVSEFGYLVKFIIEENFQYLKYRVGHYCFDTGSKVISTQNPLRYDKEKDIPFP